MITQLRVQKLWFWLLWGLCLSFAWSPAVVAASSAQQAEVTADTIDFDETRGEVRLLGNVRLVYGDMTITSAFAQYSTQAKEANLQGQVKVVDGDYVLTGNQMTAWFGNSLAQMRGQARMVFTRPLAGADKTILEADAISYNWQNKVAQVQGKVCVVQNGRRAYADSAEYDETAKTIALKGNVRFEQGKDEWLMCQRVVIDLAKRKVAAEGQVTARLVIGAGSLSKDSKVGKKENTEIELEPIEPAPDPQTVEDISGVLLPGLEN